MVCAAIDTTSTIVQVLANLFIIGGVVLAVGSLRVSSKSLEEAKKATRAQTLFAIQRFGFEVRQDFLEDPHFRCYLSTGMQWVPQHQKARMVRKFATLLSAYYVIYSQRMLKNFEEHEWELFKREFGKIMRSKGAEHFYEQRPMDKSAFDEEFKTLVTTLRREEPHHASSS